MNSGRSIESARSSRRLRPDARGPLDRVGELGGMGRGQRHNRTASDERSRVDDAEATAVCGSTSIPVDGRRGGSPRSSRLSSMRRAHEHSVDELGALVGLDRQRPGRAEALQLLSGHARRRGR